MELVRAATPGGRWNGELRMESGEWRVESGEWRVESGGVESYVAEGEGTPLTCLGMKRDRACRNPRRAVECEERQAKRTTCYPPAICLLRFIL